MCHQLGLAFEINEKQKLKNDMDDDDYLNKWHHDFRLCGLQAQT